MAKDKKVVPGPGNPEGPKSEEAKPPVAEAAPPAGKDAEDLQEFAMSTFESGALRAAQDNRNRAAAEAQAAQVQFADLVEEVVDGINEKKGTKFKVEQVRNINVKKGLIQIALPKKGAKK